MCSLSECGRYCVRIMTSEIPEFTQLESVKSMMRYLPANGTAGFARFSLRTARRDPSPPARMTARALIGAALRGCARLSCALVEFGILLRRPRPRKVARHAVVLQLTPSGGLSVYLEAPLQGVPERPGVELVE